MAHGIDPYFHELTNCRRRFALASGAVALLSILLLLSLRDGDVRDALENPRRFGFEGPAQWVERIRLEEMAEQEQPGTTQLELVERESHKGGRRAERSDPRLGEVPASTARAFGEGEEDRDLLARARALRLEGPVIMSDQLISEKLVRPEYPDEAIEKNIEGVVELVALVDTTGAVIEVQVLKSPNPLLEKAAIDAVLECRYRPFRLHEHTLRTWAAFRYAFSLYER